MENTNSNINIVIRNENDFIVLSDKDVDKKLVVDVNSVKYINTVYKNIIDTSINELTFFKDGVDFTKQTITNEELTEQLDIEKDKNQSLKYENELLSTDVDSLIVEVSSLNDEVDILQQDKTILMRELFDTYENLKPDVGTFIKNTNAWDKIYLVQKNNVTEIKEKKFIPNLYTLAVLAWHRGLTLKENDPIWSEFIRILEISEFDIIPIGENMINSAPTVLNVPGGTVFINKLNFNEKFLYVYEKLYKIGISGGAQSDILYEKIIDYYKQASKYFYDGYLSKISIAGRITFENIDQFLGGTSGASGTGGTGGTSGTGGGSGSQLNVSFDMSTYIAVINQEVSLDALVSGGYAPYIYLWTFSNQPTTILNTDQQHTVVAYGHKGVFTIKLKVTDNTGIFEEHTEQLIVEME